MITYNDLFKEISSLENLFLSWEKFKQGKSGKIDVARFERRLEPNLLKLQRDLRSGRYRHGAYTGFYICDPKVRHIHKATVRDRVVHHAVFRVLNRVFEPTFISTSFSCRVGKGNHKGVKVLSQMARKVSKNYTKSCYALKCDIKKFFDSVDQTMLVEIIEKKVTDKQARWLIREIITSFSSAGAERERERERFVRGAERYSNWQPDIPVVCQYLYECV